MHRRWRGQSGDKVIKRVTLLALGSRHGCRYTRKKTDLKYRDGHRQRYLTNRIHVLWHALLTVHSQYICSLHTFFAHGLRTYIH